LPSSLLFSSCFFFYSYLALLILHSFPTRRSSDLSSPIETPRILEISSETFAAGSTPPWPGLAPWLILSSTILIWSALATRADQIDRKSTRLNSSHGSISYAVFCLKKKRYKHTTHF